MLVMLNATHFRFRDEHGQAIAWGRIKSLVDSQLTVGDSQLALMPKGQGLKPVVYVDILSPDLKILCTGTVDRANRSHDPFMACTILTFQDPIDKLIEAVYSNPNNNL